MGITSGHMVVAQPVEEGQVETCLREIAVEVDVEVAELKMLFVKAVVAAQHCPQTSSGP